MSGKKWENSDNKNLGSGLLDPISDDYPYLAEIRDKLDLIIGNYTTGNCKTATFNITDVTQFQNDLDAWYADPAHADFIIVSREYIRDAAGTNIYLITYM